MDDNYFLLPLLGIVTVTMRFKGLREGEGDGKAGGGDSGFGCKEDGQEFGG